MRKIFSPLLSLFTVVGGHFLNRRLDLGLLFFALLLAVLVVSGGAFPVTWKIMSGESPWSGATIIGVALVMTATAVILLLSSLVVSYKKAESAPQRPPLSKAGVVGGLLAILLSLPAMGWIAVMDIQYFGLARYDAVGLAGSSGEGSYETQGPMRGRLGFFHELVRYGGGWVPDERLEPMPEGDAYITGRILYQGRPVVNATLTMSFYSRYLSEQIVTDSDGLFTLKVPEQEWTLNYITITGWPDQPLNKEFTVVGGPPNPILSESMYHAGPAYESEGQLLQATKTPTVLPELELTINPNVELLWPERARQDVDLEQDRISWTALPGASRYQLQLHSMEREGRSTTYHPVVWINTADTEVPLHDIKTIPDEMGGENEYAVEVYAFDENGELLAGNSKFIDGQSLMLKGMRVVETDNLLSIGPGSNKTEEEFQKEMETIFRDKKRLNAAELLIEDGMPDIAKTLVQRVESPSLEDKKMRVEGLMLAEEGRCEEARAKLDAVNKASGRKCYPVFFRKRCEGGSDK